MGKSLVQSKTFWGIMGLLSAGTLTPAIISVLGAIGVAVDAANVQGLATIASGLLALYGRETASQPITGVITPGKAS